MSLYKRFPTFIIIGIMFFLIGCSQGVNPMTPSGIHEKSDTMPLVIADQSGMYDSLGVMGVYQLSINTSEMTAELTTKRIGTIGESYIVSGIGFFTVTPCSNCLSLAGFEVLGRKIALKFRIEHPFDPGNPADPPSAKNRLDLDVFDLAMVIVPKSAYPINFPLTGVNVYADIVSNASGYTRELKNLINNDIAMPYVLVVDNTKSPPPHSWNKFAMGAESFFDVFFKLTPGLPLNFDTYLTMGYGASAKRPQRLEPKYYNPEFNRKAAWKVDVYPPGPWLDNQPIPTTVKVKVYDWQIGATIWPEPTLFENAHESNIFASSEVESVSIEIPSMAPSPFTSSTPTGGSGMPGDPLIYNIQVINVNMLPPGRYTGIVKVTDERSPLTPANGRDFLIDSPDGINLNNYIIPEYATYQTFKAEIIHAGITIEQVDYSIYNSPEDQSMDNSAHGSVTVGYIGNDPPPYFNLIVNGDWVVENILLLPHAGTGVAQSLTIGFDLGVPDGTDVTEVLAGWTTDSSPRLVPPSPDGFYSVGDRDVTMGPGFTYGHIDIKPPVNLRGGALASSSSWAVCGRNMPGLDCAGLFECVLAATSNSLGWLQDAYGIPPSDKAVDDMTMVTATGWDVNGCTSEWPATKDSYMDNNGYGINTDTYPPGDPPNNLDPDHDATAADCDNAMNAVNGGRDVEICGGDHCAALIGMARLANGTYQMTVAHDTDQDGDGGVKIETVIYDPGPPATTSGGWSFDGNPINGFVSESPWP